MGRSRSRSLSSDASSRDSSCDRKHLHRHRNRRLESSDSRVRSTVQVIEATTRSSERSFTPPPRDSVQRLELLVEKLIERDVTSRPGPSKVFVKPECIPEFKPGNPNLSCAKWLEKIEQLGKINQWDDYAKTFCMQNRLGGLARKWYGNQNSYDLSWAEWKQLLLKSFPEHQDYASLLRKLLNRRKLPTEGWEEYYFDKMDLVNACEISPKNAVSCIIDGINDPTIQVGARAGRYGTPDALYAEFLSSLKQQIVPWVFPNSGRAEKRFHSKDRSNFEQPAKKIKSNTKNGQKCYNCRQSGHFSNSCPKPRIECSRCKRLGHLEKDCRRLFRNQVVEFDDFRPGHNEKYFFDSIINGKPFKAYVDTGCGAILIREEQARQLKLKILPSSLTITGYGGSVVTVLGETDFTIELDHAKANVKAFVVPDSAQEVHVMVGQPFLNLPEVMMIVADGKVRILSSHNDLSEVLRTAKRKIPLWAKKSVVVPPKTSVLVAVTSRGSIEGEVKKIVDDLLENDII